MKIYLSLSLDPRVLKDNLKTYKSYFKLWKASGGQLRWNEIFEGKYKIILPLSGNSIEKSVEEELQKNNVILLSYKENKAKDKYGREVKISKLLKGDLLQKFNADPLRQGGDQETNVDSEGKVVVISRHPIDVVSMSTGSTWRSCMTLAHKNYVPVIDKDDEGSEYPVGSKIAKGEFADKLKSDIKEGTIVAYVVAATDTKTFTHPYCRIAIKPFVNLDNKNDIILVPEEKHYGDYVEGFREVVVAWLESKFQLIGDTYQKSKKVYNDDKKDIIHNKQIITDINSYPIKKQITLIKKDPTLIKYIINPLEVVQLAAVQLKGNVIQHIKNPSEEVQLAAVQQTPFAFEFIKDIASKKVQLAAITINGNVIQHILNPSEEMQLLAVNFNAYNIRFMENPSLTLQKAAISKNVKSIQNIDNPFEQIQLKAIERDKNAIMWIKNPTKRAQLLAIYNKSPSVNFKHIKNPIPEVLSHIKGK